MATTHSFEIQPNKSWRTREHGSPSKSPFPKNLLAIEIFFELVNPGVVITIHGL